MVTVLILRSSSVYFTKVYLKVLVRQPCTCFCCLFFCTYEEVSKTLARSDLVSIEIFCMCSKECNGQISLSYTLM